MREVKDLINTKTGEKIYPKSHAQATYLSDGRNVEEVINNSVLYTEQSLTEEQQAQVRENINAVSNDDTTYILSLSPEFNEEEGTSATGTLTKEQYDKIISCKNLVLELSYYGTYQSVNFTIKMSEEGDTWFMTNSHDISIGETGSSTTEIHATTVQFHPSTDGNTYSYQLFFYAAVNSVYTTNNTFVKCDHNQYLTEEQQAQARKNINAVSANDIVNTECITKITYSELVTLRDNSQLMPGTWYRITDYVTTTSQGDTQSAGHQFDIIVNALNENTLSEDAKACLHEGDTYFSEAGANLEAWKIWYCLDNDTSRFDWALAKGKSIVVDLSEMEVGITTATLNGTFVYEDTTYTKWNASVEGMDMYILTPSEDVTIGSTPMVYMVLMDVAIEVGTITSVIVNEAEGKGVIYRMIDEWNNDVPYDFKNIQFKRKLTDGVLDLEGGTDTFCYTFTSINEGNLLDESFNTAVSNVFGVKCWNNVFLGNNCISNSFGNGCLFNSFGNHCVDNSFGNNCGYNSFGNRCGYNSFGNECLYNSFGDNCLSNSFGNLFVSNSFGNSCSDNSFGNGCAYNSFGSGADNLKAFYQYNSFGDGCEYINLANDETASQSTQVQNYKLAQGLKGTYNYPITITTARNRKYETKVAKNSSGAVKVYCEADLIQ